LKRVKRYKAPLSKVANPVNPIHPISKMNMILPKICPILPSPSSTAVYELVLDGCKQECRNLQGNE
jgi:hypothetical protein